LSRWRFEYEGRNLPLLDLHVQAKGHPVAVLTGTLDSGATDTVLSIKAAEKLGLTLADLRPSHPVTIADNSDVPSWITDVPVRAQVQIHLPDTHDLIPWGPIFDLHPVFMETGSPLWGQEDFCASFKVNLERFLLPAHFVLEYWAGMSDGAPRAR
jgi:hypothetical protein